MSFTLTMFVWKVIFIIAIWKFADSSTPITEHACQFQELNLSCEEGNVIRVIRANYGRLSRDLCNNDGQVQWSGSNCTADSTYPIINDRCAQKQSCSIAADHRIFGDPCFGTLKYLEVQYVCEPPNSSIPKTEYSCQDKVLNLTCEEGKVIRIMRANYGRLVRDFCNDDGQVRWSGDYCMADGTYTITTDRCGQKQRCSIKADNRTFGDPCFGTLKYLEVQYVCEPQTENNAVHACENNQLTLSCEEGRVIHVIRANYGRLSKDICNDDGQVRWSGEDCATYSSFSIVNDRCTQKQRCSIESSNKIFGDRCPGTTKYLEVQYECLPPRK